MEEFLFYVKLGIQHVLDSSAYDHVLFLMALAVPFTFKSWKKVLLLATVFTIAHCVSLALSVYEVMMIDVAWIEVLILVSIVLAALFNLLYTLQKSGHKSVLLHLIITAFFGAIHGFGFSNYFKLLMAEEDHKLSPLLGFATGIEISQVLIVVVVLVFAYLVQELFKVKQRVFVIVMSLIIIGITIPLLAKIITS